MGRGDIYSLFGFVGAVGGRLRKEEDGAGTKGNMGVGLKARWLSKSRNGGMKGMVGMKERD